LPTESDKIETINELRIWLDGKFNLLSQAQKASAEDLIRVRSTLHDLSNQVQVLVSLNIPSKFETFTENFKKHDTQIEGLIRDGIARKSSLATARLLFITIGGIMGTMATLLIQVWGTAHH
jgi:hypothetical protein